MNSLAQFKAKYLKNPKVKELTTIPYNNPKFAINPKWLVPNKGEVYVIDTLYLPKDKQGYQYVCCIVDASSLNFDAEPMKDRSSDTIVAALRIILKRKFIKKLPNYKFVSDGGVEFKKFFKEYVEKNDIHHQVTMSNRHSQTILIDSRMRIISNLLALTFVQQELDYKEEKKKNSKLKMYYSWRAQLTQIIKIYNTPKYIKGDLSEDAIEKLMIKPIKVTSYNQYILKIGQKVLVKLDYPKDHLNNKRLGDSKWRSGDIRWTDPDENFSIYRIIFNAGQPPQYVVQHEDDNGNMIIRKNAIYTRQQLQLVN